MGTYLRQVYPNELWHHGINGQKWGDRNGPPYPLSYGQHTPEERHKNKGLMRKIKSAYHTTANTVRNVDRKVKEYERKAEAKRISKKKEKLLKTANADEFYKNKRLFTNDELDSIIERLEKEDTLKLMTTPAKEVVSNKSEEAARRKEEGYNKVKQIASEAVFWGSTASSLATSTYSLFDNGRKAYNVYSAYKNAGNSPLGLENAKGDLKPIKDLNSTDRQNEFFKSAKDKKHDAEMQKINDEQARLNLESKRISNAQAQYNLAHPGKGGGNNNNNGLTKEQIEALLRLANSM